MKSVGLSLLSVHAARVVKEVLPPFEVVEAVCTVSDNTALTC